MKHSIFYAWQSDSPNKTNRGLIEAALEKAVKELRTQCPEDVTLALLQAARDEPGAPEIPAVIFERIGSATAVVADVTFINDATDERATPNPNVMIEVGYALAKLSDDRLVLVQNVAFNGTAQLPFDIRNRQVLRYEARPDAPPAEPRKILTAQLITALGGILSKHNVTGNALYSLTLHAEDSHIAPQNHDYKICATFTNNSDQRLDDWELTLEVPKRPYGAAGISYAALDKRRSVGDTAFFAISNETQQVRQVKPGDSASIGVVVRLDERMAHERDALIAAPVIACAYVKGTRVGTQRRTLGSMQRFWPV